MVSLCDRDFSQFIVDHAQRHCLDEKQAISLAQSQLLLHRYGHVVSTILDSRNVCELHVFQQHQQPLPLHATLRGNIPVSIKFMKSCFTNLTKALTGILGGFLLP
jgi:hypothetical protein